MNAHAGKWIPWIWGLLAVALLGAAGVLPAERLEGWFLAGELSLSGAIKPVPGVLPLGMLARNEGSYVVATFLVGTQGTVSWEGILYDVGNDFITIYPPMVRRRWTKPYGSSWVNAS